MYNMNKNNYKKVYLLNNPTLKLQEKNKQNYFKGFPLFLALSRIGNCTPKVGSLMKAAKSLYSAGLIISLSNEGLVDTW